MCVIGCGGVGLQVIAGARLAGAGRIIAVDRLGRKARAGGAARSAPTPSTGSQDAVVAAVLELVPGGVDYAFEVVGLPVTDPPGVGHDPGRAARRSWSGLAPKGAEVSLPALDLLSEKNLRGCYYGSSNVAAEMPALIGLAADGRLDMGDVVSHLIELDQINEAFDRLRTARALAR